MKRFLFVPVLLLLLCSMLIPASSVVAADKFVAVIITGDLPRYRQAHDAFMKILEKGGMSADKVEIHVQRPNPDPMSWANSIRKAVGVGADVIVTYGAPATIVAKKQAKGTPVLFADVCDPVALGIVKGLATPGGDITGVASGTPVETLLKSYTAVHKPKNIGVMYSKSDKGSVLQLSNIEKLAGKYGFNVVKIEAKNAKSVLPAFESASGKIDSLFLTHCAVLEPNVKDLIGKAKGMGKPVISQAPGLADLGALMTLEADPTEQGQLVGVHALQVLQGSKAFTLPVRTPKKVSLVINMQTANSLGLKVPFDTLNTATRVVK